MICCFLLGIVVVMIAGKIIKSFKYGINMLITFFEEFFLGGGPGRMDISKYCRITDIFISV